MPRRRKGAEDKPRDMKIVTVNLLKYQSGILDIMTDNGIIPSRSEGMRQAIDLFIRDKMALLQVIAVIQPTPAIDIGDPPGPISMDKIDMRNASTLDAIRKKFGRP